MPYSSADFPFLSFYIAFIISCWLTKLYFFVMFLVTSFIKLHLFVLLLRDRPFNLKGGEGYGFLFRSEILFRTTQELEYLFFCRAKRKFFFQNLTLGYMTKTLNQIILFSFTKIKISFFSNIGNQNIFWKTTIPPPPFKLNGRSLRSSSFKF